jgi:hypothetical protein
MTVLLRFCADIWFLLSNHLISQVHEPGIPKQAIATRQRAPNPRTVRLHCFSDHEKNCNNCSNDESIPVPDHASKLTLVTPPWRLFSHAISLHLTLFCFTGISQATFLYQSSSSFAPLFSFSRFHFQNTCAPLHHTAIQSTSSAQVCSISKSGFNRYLGLYLLLRRIVVLFHMTSLINGTEHVRSVLGPVISTLSTRYSVVCTSHTTHHVLSMYPPPQR